RGAGRIHRQERQIAGIADIQRARVERFEDRCGSRKFRPFDLVRQIFRVARDFEQGTVAALLVADAKRHGVRGQRRCSNRHAHRRAEQRGADEAETRVGAPFKFGCLHVFDLSISSAALSDAISDAQSLRAAVRQSMKWLTEYFAERAMNISALKW